MQNAKSFQLMGAFSQTPLGLRRLFRPQTPDFDPLRGQIFYIHFLKNCYQFLLQKQIFKTKITLRCNQFYFAKLSIRRAFTLSFFDTAPPCFLGRIKGGEHWAMPPPPLWSEMC